ncbi:SAM-dependent methyltransferase [Rhodovulum iodosum]|uniref:SAM-dependent methyltransferase n=1 Tax=Rhodovulum iodosum TaxID=68291 RepID=A0ABV3XP04_9RHOB|nr:class I SAM-dependent methyltransferase [Rhodovulum robiginosum]RSK37987.1 class I SAM-dependent methyltransferase [Rhodovulum robiginosum]
MPQNDPAHWDRVYGAREERALSWFQDRPEPSLSLIERHAPAGDVLDVGAGAARLADALLARGRTVALLDLSAVALAATRARLGALAGNATFITADVTRWQPPRRWAVWHDRAVFHFLTEPARRAGYTAALDAALAMGGVAVIATFAPEGPETCSGLPVCRYTPEALSAELDRLLPGQLALVEACALLHETPAGQVQAFQVSVFRRTGRTPLSALVSGSDPR